MKGAIGSTLVGLKALDKIQTKFLEYTIKQQNNFIKETSTGTGLQHINKDFFEICRIPLPPLAEQDRIVAKLNAVMQKVESNKQRLDKIPKLLKRFRQSVIDLACSGKLSEGDVEFKLTKFEFLLKSIRGGTTGVPQNTKTYYPVLRSSSVRQGQIDYQDVKYLSQEQSLNKNNFLDLGDLLFTRLNGTAEYVGNCAKVNIINASSYQFPDRLYCAKLIPEVDSNYCVYAFATTPIRIEIENRAKSTAGHKRISISDIKDMSISLPPLEEQKKIVKQVEQLFAFADKIEARYTKAKAMLDKLPQSILAKAFRGELVPQDSNDEPASVLLARIKAEKEKLAKEKKKKKD